MGLGGFLKGIGKVVGKTALGAVTGGPGGAIGGAIGGITDAIKGKKKAGGEASPPSVGAGVPSTVSTPGHDPGMSAPRPPRPAASAAAWSRRCGPSSRRRRCRRKT